MKKISSSFVCILLSAILFIPSFSSASCLAVPCGEAVVDIDSLDFDAGLTGKFEEKLIFLVKGKLKKVKHVDCRTDKTVSDKDLKKKFFGFKGYKKLPKWLVLTLPEAIELGLTTSSKQIASQAQSKGIKVKIQEDCCDAPPIPCISGPFMTIAE